MHYIAYINIIILLGTTYPGTLHTPIGSVLSIPYLKVITH